MLRRFLYLDQTAVRQYASMIDGGLPQTSTSTQRSGQATGGAASVKVVSGSHERNSETEDSRVIEDTDEARFDRIVRAANADPERLDWSDVLQPDIELAAARTGTLVSWDCDVWVPPVSQMLSSGSEFAFMLSLLRTVGPAARALGGKEIPNLPEDDQLAALERLTTVADGRLVFVGDREGETEWKVTGTLNSDWVQADIEGEAIVVGKVVKVIPEGQWKPLLALPGMTIGSRADRRARARQRPEPGQEGNYVAGPAIALDVLAIYR